eukprot:483073-Rhodomonas_salina.3
MSRQRSQIASKLAAQGLEVRGPGVTHLLRLGLEDLFEVIGIAVCQAVLLLHLRHLELVQLPELRHLPDA